MKRFLVVITSFVLVIVWVATLSGIGSFGPIKKDMKLGLDISGGVYVVLEADTNKTGTSLQTIMEQTQTVIERRVNEMGLSEPVVTVEGEKRIRVELPGATDADEAIETIGTTAQLSFHTADGKTKVKGDQIKDAGYSTDTENGGYKVDLTFTDEGGEGFAAATKTASESSIKDKNLVKTYTDEETGETDIVPGSGKYPIIKKTKKDKKIAEDDQTAVAANSVLIVLDNKIISQPTAESEITGGQAIITGNFTKDQAQNLAMLIRGGALPVELTEVESSEVGASIGIGALKNSIIAGIIGVLLIFLLMLIMYRIFGLAANLALLLYIPLMLWIMVFFGAVLTLPGIAGIILSIGMAVDSNVIIFARIKEEALAGKDLELATSQGFRRAVLTVIDAQLTTLIAAIVLYIFGTGPVRGFAFTLILGILLGVFTALCIAHIYVNFIVGSKLLTKKFLIGFSPKYEGHQQRETIGTKEHKFSFIKHRKIYYIVTVCILLIGLGFVIFRGFNLGIDFTGGTRIQVEFENKIKVSELEKTLEENGVKNPEVTSVGKTGKGYMIKTKTALTKDDREKIEKALDDNKNLKLGEDGIQSFEQFGPSIGKLLTMNAIKSILIAALGMLIYIFFRFRWRFAVSSIIGVFHDVLIMIAFYAIFGITVNNPFIAAILTIVGYSINDTIVVFDRIRENHGIYTNTSKMPLDTLIDRSIYQTLVRSVTTGLSTILAIVPLVILGGDTIREFALPLLVGIAVGVFSSIFIASSLYYEFAKGIYKKDIKYFGAPKKGTSKKVVKKDRADSGAVV